MTESIVLVVPLVLLLLLVLVRVCQSDGVAPVRWGGTSQMGQQSAHRGTRAQQENMHLGWLGCAAAERH